MTDIILIHSGAKGQRWGIRNYRNYDGTLTEEGRQRYDYYDNKTDRVYNTARMKQLGPKMYNKTNRWGVLQEDLTKFSNDELRSLTERAKLENEYRSAFNTNQYTKGKKFIEGFKQTMREVGDIAQAGKKLIDGINGIREGIAKAQELDEKSAAKADKIKNKATKDAEKKANKIMKDSNDREVKDWLLSITNPGKRSSAMKFVKNFNGGKGSYYGDITPSQLAKIKKLF